MGNDYRRTPYEGEGDDFKAKKMWVEKLIKAKHPRANLYTQINNNKGPYKMKFIQAYGGKCAYCGVSIQLITKEQFEIDHYIPHTDQRRFKNKKEASYMDNLVLACYDCNRNKHSYSISDAYLSRLHPDGAEIKNCYYRNDNYYIKIEKDVEEDKEITGFYNALRLGSEKHRLDYLLMRMRGLREKHKENSLVNEKLGESIELLQEKRNIGINVASQ